MKKDFELIVIGGGSGGIATANKAASFGIKTALVERQYIGGTCVNLGCIPKKIMWNAADIANTLGRAKEYGFNLSEKQFDWEHLYTNRQNFIEKLHQIYRKKLSDNKVEFIQGDARFQDRHTIVVKDKLYSAKYFVIATGCKPIWPTIPGAELGIDSDGFFALRTVPQNIAVVGAGYIAVELASMLNILGCKVKLIIRHERFLRNFDRMIGDTLRLFMEQQGIEIISNCVPVKLQKKQNKLALFCEDDNILNNLDQLIWAIGRKPQNTLLGLDKLEIKLTNKGYIETDKYQNTNIENIFAVGDVTGRRALTPVAIAAGRRLATRLFGNDPNSYLDYELIPSVIFTHPPAGTIGLSEEKAVEKWGKDNIQVFTTKFTPLSQAFSEEKEQSVVKIVTLKKDDRIIGCHLCGESTDEILQGFSVAIKMGATLKDFTNTLGIHPTSAEEVIHIHP